MEIEANEGAPMGTKINHRLLSALIVLCVSCLIHQPSILANNDTQNPQNDTQPSVSLSQNANTILLMPNENPTLNYHSPYKFNKNNPAPIGMKAIFIYLEGIIIKNNTPATYEPLKIYLMGKSYPTFMFDDGTNRTFYDNETITGYYAETMTDAEGYFYIIVPHAGLYQVYVESSNYSMLVYPYIYFDYAELYSGVYLTEIYPHTNYTQFQIKTNYLSPEYLEPDVASAVVDSGSRFLIGFFLFVGVLAVPIGIIGLVYWVFTKYFG